MPLIIGIRSDRDALPWLYKNHNFARKRPGVLFSRSLPASWLDVGGLLAYPAADKRVVALSCTGWPDLEHTGHGVVHGTWMPGGRRWQPGPPSRGKGGSYGVATQSRASQDA